MTDKHEHLRLADEPPRAEGYRKLMSAYERLIEQSDRQEDLLNKARETVTK
jgi:hypothetical protein